MKVAVKKSLMILNLLLAPYIKRQNNMKREDLKKETTKYFEVKDPKFARFYLLPKIHKWLNKVPGRHF